METYSLTALENKQTNKQQENPTPNQPNGAFCLKGLPGTGTGKLEK